MDHGLIATQRPRGGGIPIGTYPKDPGIIAGSHQGNGRRTGIRIAASSCSDRSRPAAAGSVRARERNYRYGSGHVLRQVRPDRDIRQRIGGEGSPNFRRAHL